MTTLSVFLPGESPWTEEPGGLQSMGRRELDMTERLVTGKFGMLLFMGLQRVRHDCYNFACSVYAYEPFWINFCEGWKNLSRFFFFLILRVDVQLFKHHLLKRLCSSVLAVICGSLFLNSLFYSADLFAHSFMRTTLF